MKHSILSGFNYSTPALVVECAKDSSIDLGVIRSLGRLGVPVYGIGGSPGLLSTFSRYFRKCFMYKLPAPTPEDELVDFLIHVAKEIGRVVPLFTMDEIAILFAKYNQVLREWFLVPEMNHGPVSLLTNKWEMQLLAEKHGVPTAKSIIPMTMTEAEEFSKLCDFPLVFKSSEWTDNHTRPSDKTLIINSPEELIRQCEVFEQKGWPHVILQEYISGAGVQDWMFNGYFDERSACLAAFSGRKVRQSPVGTGYTSLGECSKNEIVESTSIKFLQDIGYKGPVDIDFRFDPRDGLYKILDVNPRIGATFRLFVGRGGLDVVRAMYLDRTGQKVPSDILPDGRKWIVEDRDFSSSYSHSAPLKGIL